MGVSIQFESHTVELWAIYTMEYDAQVLEFFDQPHQLELHYQGPSGRSTQALHTPDFLVLRTGGATFEEWKPEEKLLELMVTQPGRYQREDSGTWCCPPGEAAAANLGLSYRVHSSAELHPGYIRNLIFLEDYFFLGWQTRLEKDLLQSREIGSGILAKASLLATGLPPRGELLTHRIPRLRIFQRQCAR